MKTTIASPLSDFDVGIQRQALLDDSDDAADWDRNRWYSAHGSYDGLTCPPLSQITVQTVGDPSRIQVKVDTVIGGNGRFTILSIPTEDARRIAEAFLGIVTGMEGTDGGKT